MPPSEVARVIEDLMTRAPARAQPPQLPPK